MVILIQLSDILTDLTQFSYPNECRGFTVHCNVTIIICMYRKLILIEKPPTYNGEVTKAALRVYHFAHFNALKSL